MSSKLETYGTPGQVQGTPVYCLNGDRHRDGVTFTQAFVWNVGTCRLDVKGEMQVEAPQV